MLSSLFGDLAPRRAPEKAATPAERGFADTTVLEDSKPQAPPRGPAAHSLDVFVSGSPAVAIRDHFASSRADLDRATSMITLLDPSRIWAPAVIKALSDATGAPVEKLNLRERGTLRTLAVVERTAVRLRSAGPLKVYHADVRSLGAEHDEIVNALAERSHMTVVIVGAMQPHALELLMRSLLDATRLPQWHCPRLAFLLPPGAFEAGHRILARDWPSRVRVSVVAEALTGASSAWNTILAAWEEGLDTVPNDPRLAGNSAQTLDSGLLTRQLQALARTEGVMGCAVIDLERGDMLLSESRAMTSAGLTATTRALAEARAAHGRAAGPGMPVPEEVQVISSAGIDLLRCAPPPSRLGLVLRLDRHGANLPAARSRMAEVERLLR
jgi:hypothetical protein